MSATQVCGSCGADVPIAHRFCGKCGHPMPAPVAAAPVEAVARTAFFGAMQAVGKAKLILIRGEGMDGVAYHLSNSENVAGRKTGVILFPEDSYLSPRHANFFYDGARLLVKDEGSLNGIFVRIREPVELEDGEVFLAGEELLKVEFNDLDGQMVGADYTHYFASPRPVRTGRVTQLLEGGRLGATYFTKGDNLAVGRDGCDISFPDDRFISGRHCQVVFGGGRATLTDLGSRNGTYVRIRGQRPLAHGDYLFLGKQLLRVEITTV